MQYCYFLVVVTLFSIFRKFRIKFKSETFIRLGQLVQRASSSRSLNSRKFCCWNFSLEWRVLPHQITTPTVSPFFGRWIGSFPISHRTVEEWMQLLNFLMTQIFLIDNSDRSLVKRYPHEGKLLLDYSLKGIVSDSNPSSLIWVNKTTLRALKIQWDESHL